MTDSSGSKTTPIIHFKPVFGRDDAAKVVLVLCNMSNRRMSFKLMCAPGADIVSSPCKSGLLPAKGTVRLILTWCLSLPKRGNHDHRTAIHGQVAKISLVLGVVEDDEDESKGAAPTRGSITTTELLATVVREGTKLADKMDPLLEELLVDLAPLSAMDLLTGRGDSTITVTKVSTGNEDLLINQYNFVTRNALMTAAACAVIFLLLCYNNATHPLAITPNIEAMNRH